MDRFRCVARQNCATQHEAGATEKGVGAGPADERTRPEERNTDPRKQDPRARGPGNAVQGAQREGKRRPETQPEQTRKRARKSQGAVFFFFKSSAREKKKQIHFLKEFKLQMDLFFFSPFSRAKRTKTQSQPEATFGQNFRTPWPKRRKRGRKQALFESFFWPS
jgi:hypothetical protein